ncbi:MAG: sulfurtransferase [Burkholderiaceae bacterium]
MPAHPDLLVTPDWLQPRLGRPGLAILECTATLQPQPVGASRYVSGRPAFERDHIPGARHVDMRDEMSDPAGRYPYTLPTPAQLEARLAALGIGADDHIVLYARGNVMAATRIWYVLHALGARRLSLLDGGYERWVAEGRPVWRAGDVAGTDAAPGTPFSARLAADRVADLARVRASLDDPATCRVNALSAEQFAGTGGAHYGRPGRIPGSVSVPARELLDARTGCFLDRETLRARMAQAGALDAPHVIVYCGGGIAATVDAFVLELLGHPDWAVYDNSLLEWSARPEMPMELG